MQNRKDSGVTLYELLFVVMIIGIVAAILVTVLECRVYTKQKQQKQATNEIAHVSTPLAQTQDPRYKTFLIEINIPSGCCDLDWKDNRDTTLTDYTRKFFTSLDKQVDAILAKNPNCEYKSREIVNGRIYMSAYSGYVIQLPSAASVVLDCDK